MIYHGPRERARARTHRLRGGGFANDEFGLEHDLFVLEVGSALRFAQQQVHGGIANERTRLPNREPGRSPASSFPPPC